MKTKASDNCYEEEIHKNNNYNKKIATVKGELLQINDSGEG